VHRDVKPANILLENGVERARLTDFGLARAVSAAGLTQSGVVAGTPQYMAPEQARGESVDHRADLFSLGSTLYAMCSGHPPFRAESAVAVLRRVSDDEARPIREINAEVPMWFAEIIAKLHAKDPDQRFQTASEVSDLLGRCLAHLQQPLTVPLPHTPSRMTYPFWRRRHFTRWAIAVAVLLSAAATVPLVLHRSNQPEVEEQVEVKEAPALQSLEAVRPGGLGDQGRDEMDDQIQPLRTRAEALEADLNRRNTCDSEDPIAAEIQRALQEAHLLEQEIQSGAIGAPGSLGNPSLYRR
jgi:serine/threonine-protein kinase